MLKFSKKLISIVFAIAIAATCTVTAFAAEELEINSTATAGVGDTITYKMFLGDCTQQVEGIQMYIYYDKEYLKVDRDSMAYDNFDGVIQNPDLDGYVTFNWTNVTDLADFSKTTGLVSLDFEVLKAGKTDITYVIQELYGDDMTYLKSYTLTYSITDGGKALVENETPIVVSDANVLNNRQGDFINYADGKGEENSPNKEDHQAATGDINQGTQLITNIVDVTKQVTTTTSTDNSGIVTAIVIATVVIVGLAIVAVLIVRKKDMAANSNAETENTDDNLSEND